MKQLITHSIVALGMTLGMAVSAHAGVSLTFTGTLDDGNATPFSVAFFASDISPGAGNYNSFDADLDEYWLLTEQTSETPIYTDIVGNIFGGAYSQPAASPSDPYEYFELSDISSFGFADNFIQAFTNGDEPGSNLGLTFNGELVTYLELGGEFSPLANFPATDADTISSVLPFGSYALSDGYGFLSTSTSSLDFDPTELIVAPVQMTSVPEPPMLSLFAVAGLVGAIALRRRRRQARA